MKKVSIIIPNYNHAPYLRERIESVLAQDYPEKEILLLDDASSDESANILREYAARPEIKELIINEKNSGNTFAQWQRGLAKAEGEYVWIAESDDTAQPTLLSALVKALEEQGAAVAFCASNKIDEHGAVISGTRDRRWRYDFTMEGTEFARKYLLGYSYICNASAVVFRREAATKVRFDQVQLYPASGDRYFWIEMAKQGKVAYIAQALNGFRQHTQKVSGSAESQGLNICQDHAIYSCNKDILGLTSHQKRLICGYHRQAIYKSTVTEEGRKRALDAWKTEKEFGRAAWALYMLYRAKEKLFTW